MEAISAAQAALAQTTFNEPSAHAWSEQERLELATALGDLSARLLFDPSDRSTFFDVESIGPGEIESDASLMDAIIELDLRMGNLEEVESTLFDLALHSADLKATVRTGGDAATYRALTDQILDAADRIAATLLSGAYLTEADLATWNDPMAQVAGSVQAGGPRKGRRAKDRWLQEVRRIDADISRVADKDLRGTTAEDPTPGGDGGPTSRLEQLDTELVAQLRALSPERLRFVSARVATGAVNESSLRDPRLAVLDDLEDRGPFGESPERAGVLDLVEELDEGAVRVEEAIGRGLRVRSAQRGAPTRQAHAARAVWYALSSDPLEAAAESTCEAIQAVGDSEKVLRFVRQLLSN